MTYVLPASFYAGTDPVTIAQQLLGKHLVSEIDGSYCSGIIVETEAYKAPEDLACHARGNRRTPRTETMFAGPGTAYIYKCYGIHDLFNVVTGPPGFAHAILIRAIQPLKGHLMIAKRRKLEISNKAITNGPGKLTKGLGITTDLDATAVYNTENLIRIEAGEDIPIERIVAGPRVGMSHHTKHCGYYPWRFRVKNNEWTSKPDTVKYSW